MTRIISYLMTAILSVGFTLIGEGAMRAPKTSTDGNGNHSSRTLLFAMAITWHDWI